MSSVTKRADLFRERSSNCTDLFSPRSARLCLMSRHVRVQHMPLRHTARPAPSCPFLDTRRARKTRSNACTLHNLSSTAAPFQIKNKGRRCSIFLTLTCRTPNADRNCRRSAPVRTQHRVQQSDSFQSNRHHTAVCNLNFSRSDGSRKWFDFIHF